MKQELQGLDEAIARAKREVLAMQTRFGGVLFLCLLALWAAIASGAWSALGASSFRAFVFLTRFVEVLGWGLCLTVVGVPAGVLLVLLTQGAQVLAAIHGETRCMAGGRESGA